MSWDVVMNSGYEWLISSTSSTAQGGGGNFKNGKPIGEVSWCDAKMAERTHWWIERWLSVSPFLSLFLSVSLFRHLSTELPFKPSTYLPVYSCIYRSICLFTYLLNCLSFCLSSHSSIHLLLSVSFLFPSISSSIHVHSYPSPCSSFCFSIDSSMHLSVYLFFQLSIHLSSYPCVYLVIDASSDLSI